MAGQVEVVHNGWHQGQTTKRGRDATFGPNCQILKLSFPKLFLTSLLRQGEVGKKRGVVASLALA